MGIFSGLYEKLKSSEDNLSKVAKEAAKLKVQIEALDKKINPIALNIENTSNEIKRLSGSGAVAPISNLEEMFGQVESPLEQLQSTLARLQKEQNKLQAERKPLAEKLGNLIPELKQARTDVYGEQVNASPAGSPSGRDVSLRGNSAPSLKKF
jgi:chromosome segregation ATPase